MRPRLRLRFLRCSLFFCAASLAFLLLLMVHLLLVDYVLALQH